MPLLKEGISMQLLFLAPRLPLPADTGGKIRTYHILNQLAKRFTVHLVCFSFDENDRPWAHSLEKKGLKITLVPYQEPPFFAKTSRILFSSLPYSILKYYSRAMENVLERLIQAEKFDAVHVDHLHMAIYGSRFSGQPRVLDEHNVEYVILRRCAQIEKSRIKKKIFIDQSQKMQAFEMRAVHGFSRCLTVSLEDCRSLMNGTLDAGHCQVVPNGVDTQYFRPAIGIPRDEEQSLVFTGSLDWWPNEDAIVYFCQDILPQIWRQLPRLKFVIVGKSPSQRIRALMAAEPRIVVTGRVDDVRPFLSAARVFVVPLRVGGGTRLKILEAMAMQKAVVSTTLGAEGIQCASGKNILIADEPQDFASQVVALVRDEGRAMSIGKAGRDLVCSTYDWEIVGNKLESIYRELFHAS